MPINKSVLAALCIALATRTAGAGASQAAGASAVEQQIRQIAETRPPQAEVAAEEFLIRAGILGQELSMLGGLRHVSMDAYWKETATLAVQRGMVDGTALRDSVRAALMQRMFGLEYNARRLQRAYGGAPDEASRTRIRSELLRLFDLRYDLQTELMKREVGDAELRLSLVKAALARRSEVREQQVRTAVEEAVGDGRERPPLKGDIVAVFITASSCCSTMVETMRPGVDRIRTQLRKRAAAEGVASRFIGTSQDGRVGAIAPYGEFDQVVEGGGDPWHNQILDEIMWREQLAAPVVPQLLVYRQSAAGQKELLKLFQGWKEIRDASIEGAARP